MKAITIPKGIVDKIDTGSNYINTEVVESYVGKVKGKRERPTSYCKTPCPVKGIDAKRINADRYHD